MIRSLALVPIFLATACIGDETVRAYGAADKIWTLTQIDGQPFPAKATLTFPKPGQIAGKGPCNSYTGAMTAPYPWFEAGPLAATRMACPDLEAEAQFFAALSAMSQSEVFDDTLILSSEDGKEMVFIAGA